MTDQLEVAARTFFDASGTKVKDQATHQAALLAAVRTATACLELHAGPTVFQIQLVVNPNTYPFLVLAGSIGGDICTHPGTGWQVTGGSFGPNLVIAATRGPLSNAPANAASLIGDRGCGRSIGIVGFFQAPDSYAGTYGFEGLNNEFSHTTLFKGWQPCA